MKKLVILGFALCISQIAMAQKTELKDLKVNIEQIVKPFDIINNLEPIKFEFNADKYKSFKLPKSQQFGFNTAIAPPEFLKMQSNLYASGKNSTKSYSIETIDSDNIIPILVAAIKEQQIEIQQLKTEIKKLQQK